MPEQPSLSFLNRQPVWVKTLAAAACLYLFLVGIGALSGAFKVIGEDRATRLFATHSPLISLFIGILATTLVQSSSTTTSTVVAMVASGHLELDSGVYMVMGANVGTTVTNTIVSIGHITRTNEYRRAFAAATVHDFFNLIVLLVLFPLEYYTHVAFGKGFLTWVSEWGVAAFDSVGGGKFANPIKFLTKPAIGLIKTVCLGNGVAMLVVGLGLLFGALIGLVRSLKALMMHRVENLFDQVIFKTPRRSLVVGIGLTVLVQSSSVTTSLAVPLVGAGVLTIHQAFPYTMGANIGTTATALIAALGAIAAAEGDPKAAVGLLVAFHHVFFNVIGVALLWWFRGFPIRIAEAFANLAMHNRAIPIAYILFTFYLLPVLVIWIGS